MDRRLDALAQPTSLASCRDRRGNRPSSRARFLIAAALCLLGVGTACGDDQASADDEVDTVSCGPVPDGPGDSVEPQDPNSSEIVQACESWCAALATEVSECSPSETCVEDCKETACDVCPGTLAPFLDCQTEALAPEQCTCTAEGPDCPVAAGCADAADRQTQCGG